MTAGSAATTTLTHAPYCLHTSVRGSPSHHPGGDGERLWLAVGVGGFERGRARDHREHRPNAGRPARADPPVPCRDERAVRSECGCVRVGAVLARPARRGHRRAGPGGYGFVRGCAPRDSTLPGREHKGDGAGADHVRGARGAHGTPGLAHRPGSRSRWAHRCSGHLELRGPGAWSSRRDAGGGSGWHRERPGARRGTRDGRRGAR